MAADTRANGSSKSGLWRVAAVALFSAVLTGAGAWLAVGSTAVDRSEVSQMIATESPYVADRALLVDTRGKVSAMVVQVGELQQQVAVLDAKLTVLLERNGD